MAQDISTLRNHYREHSEASVWRMKRACVFRFERPAPQLPLDNASDDAHGLQRMDKMDENALAR